MLLIITMRKDEEKQEGFTQGGPFPSSRGSLVELTKYSAGNEVPQNLVMPIKATVITHEPRIPNE